MAPVFYRVEAEVEEIQGVPTDLNRMLVAGELDTAPISSIAYARNADKLKLLPRLCVASEGAVDSIQLVTRKPLEQVRLVAVTPESATSVALTKVLLPEADQVPLEAYEAGEAEAKLLIGDAALKSAFEDPTPHYDLGRLWLERTGLPMVFAVWACPEPLADGLAELEDALVSSVRRARAEPEQLAYEASERYGYPAGFLARYFEKLRYRFGPRERAGLYTFLELARDAGLLETVPELRFVSDDGGCGRVSVAERSDRSREMLEKALDGERISDEDAIALLRSRDLVAVGRVANELRNRRARPGPGHVHHRPEPQLHERLHDRLRLLRLLPGARRHARGLPAAEAGHLQEDRGDARARRHRPADAGRPPPRPRRSTTTRTSSARSRRATGSTCTRSRRRRSSTSRAARS